MVILAIVLGIYTGILFLGFQCPTVVNTSVVAFFLVWGFGRGCTSHCVTVEMEKRHTFARIDLMLIAIELVLIIHMFMGFMASTQTRDRYRPNSFSVAIIPPLLDFCGRAGTGDSGIARIDGDRPVKKSYQAAPILVLFQGSLLRFIVLPMQGSIHIGQFKNNHKPIVMNQERSKTYCQSLHWRGMRVSTALTIFISGRGLGAGGAIESAVVAGVETIAPAMPKARPPIRIIWPATPVRL